MAPFKREDSEPGSRMNPLQGPDDETLASYGWAPGDYFGVCMSCRSHFIGAKRSLNCHVCAGKNKAKVEETKRRLANDRFVSTARMPTPFQAEILDILAEECAEVIQRITKLKRFGIDEVQPGQPHDNAYRLGEEIGDLLHMIDEVAASGLVSTLGIAAGRQRKPRQLAKYLQNERGG